jgi:hypothetical protein
VSKRINWKQVAAERLDLVADGLIREREKEANFINQHAENQTLRSALSDAKRSEQYFAGQIERLQQLLRLEEHQRRTALTRLLKAEDDFRSERARSNDLVARLDWLEHNPTDAKVAT